MRGLNEAIKDSIVGSVETSDLQELITLAIKVDNRLRERRRERFQVSETGATVFSASDYPCRVPESKATNTSTPSSPSVCTEKPMQLGWNRLTPAEWNRRFKDGLCISCGEPGHQLAACPLRLNPKPHQSQTGFW